MLIPLSLSLLLPSACAPSPDQNRPPKSEIKIEVVASRPGDFERPVRGPEFILCTVKLTGLIVNLDSEFIFFIDKFKR